VILRLVVKCYLKVIITSIVCVNMNSVVHTLYSILIIIFSLICICVYFGGVNPISYKYGSLTLNNFLMNMNFE
jgi:hypothetical protein